MQLKKIAAWKKMGRATSSAAYQSSIGDGSLYDLSLTRGACRKNSALRLKVIIPWDVIVSERFSTENTLDLKLYVHHQNAEICTILTLLGAQIKNKNPLNYSFPSSWKIGIYFCLVHDQSFLCKQSYEILKIVT